MDLAMTSSLQNRRKKAAAAETTSMRTTVEVRSRRRPRMDLLKKVQMREAAGNEEVGEERGFEEPLLREHDVSTDMGSLDRMQLKIPPVLTSSQSAYHFEIVQNMKEDELAEADNTRASLLVYKSSSLGHVLDYLPRDMCDGAGSRDSCASGCSGMGCRSKHVQAEMHQQQQPAVA